MNTSFVMDFCEQIQKLARKEANGMVLRELLEGGVLGLLRLQCLASEKWYKGIEAVCLRNAEFVINTDGQADMMEQGKRTGHASIKGAVSASIDDIPLEETVEVKYRPGLGAMFMCSKTNQVIIGAVAVIIAVQAGKQIMRAWQPVYRP